MGCVFSQNTDAIFIHNNTYGKGGGDDATALFYLKEGLWLERKK